MKEGVAVLDRAVYIVIRDETEVQCCKEEQLAGLGCSV